MQPEGAVHLAFMFITNAGLETAKSSPTFCLAGAASGLLFVKLL